MRLDAAISGQLIAGPSGIIGGMGTNRIEFRIGTFKFGDTRRGEPVVHVLIDGQDLFQLIDAHAATMRTKDVKPDATSTKGPGLSPDLVRPPSRHWWGVPHPALSTGGRAVIYDCECGHWPCGGILARISVGEREVVWSDFSGPSGGSVYPIGPFRFRRQDYDDALAGIPPT